jgi:exodeoxyribonuclease VII large subunit
MVLWQSLDLLQERIAGAFRAETSRYETQLADVTGRLQSLSPLSVLARGYSISRRADDASVIRSVRDVKAEDALDTLLSDGRVISEVRQVQEGWS